MRIYFQSLSTPKKSAKRLQKHFNAWMSGFNFPEISLSDAQGLTARMLGYDDWHTLTQQSITPSTASPLDEELSEKEQLDRLHYQTLVLHSIYGLSDMSWTRELAAQLRVSCRSPASPHLFHNAYVTNSVVDVFLDQDNFTCFSPSTRSLLSKPQVLALSHELRLKRCSKKRSLAIFDELSRLLEKQPENLYARFFQVAAHWKILYQASERNLSEQQEHSQRLLVQLNAQLAALDEFPTCRGLYRRSEVLIQTMYLFVAFSRYCEYTNPSVNTPALIARRENVLALFEQDPTLRSSLLPEHALKKMRALQPYQYGTNGMLMLGAQSIDEFVTDLMWWFKPELHSYVVHPTTLASF